MQKKIMQTWPIEMMTEKLLQLILLFYAITISFCILTSEIRSWNVTFHYINYQTYGFISKGFVGSIWRFLSDEINLRYLKIFYYALNILSLWVFIYICDKVIRKLEIYARCVCYFLLCGSIFIFNATIYNVDMFLKLDLFLFWLFVLTLYIQQSASRYSFPLVIVLSVIALLIHHIYVFIFFPIVTWIIFSKKQYIKFLILCGVCLMVFIPLQKSKLAFEDYDGLVQKISKEYNEYKNVLENEQAKKQAHRSIVLALALEYRANLLTFLEHGDKIKLVGGMSFRFHNICITLILLIVMWKHFLSLFKMLKYAFGNFFMAYYFLFTLICYAFVIDYCRYILLSYTALFFALLYALKPTILNIGVAGVAKIKQSNKSYDFNYLSLVVWAIILCANLYSSFSESI